MASNELAKLVENLSQQIENSRDTLSEGERNEEWTKASIILPLLEGLGWDRGTDIGYESSPYDVEGRLDFVLKGKTSIGIEAKALDVAPPQDYDHPYIKKGMKQSIDRGASYFIWTNGDCWQFFSLALKNAPLYEITLTHERADIVTDKLSIIGKKAFSDDPDIFDEAIRENWKTRALPTAWEVVLDKHANDFYQIIAKGLPTELEIGNNEVLEFLKKLKLSDADSEPQRGRAKQVGINLSFPDDWEQLISSDEPVYEKARRRFRKDLFLKLGRHLISKNYKEWSKERTWKLLGLRDDSKEKKKSGPVIGLFRKWQFIDEAERPDMYKRVENSVEHLKKLFEKQESS